MGKGLVLVGLGIAALGVLVMLGVPFGREGASWASRSLFPGWLSCRSEQADVVGACRVLADLLGIDPDAT